MSGGLDVLALKDGDVEKFLASQVHIGDSNIDCQMKQYIYKLRQDGIPIINLKKTWEKLLFAARVIAAVENPADVCVITNRPTAQRAVLKFSGLTGSTSVAGRFTPGCFTNQIQKAFREPRILLISDPKLDHQPVTEASYVNIPVIAFCNTSSPIKNVDIAIPCNNTGKHAVGLMYWMLSREVLRLRGSISRELEWEVMPDLFFFREPEEIEKEEKAKAEEIVDTWTTSQPAEQAPVKTQPTADQWPDMQGTEWGKETTTPAAAAKVPTGPGVVPPEQEWNVPTTGTKDWGEDNAGDWGESAPTTSTTSAPAW